MRKLILALSAALSVSKPVLAQDAGTYRAFSNFGAWGARFQQSDGRGHQTDFTLLTSLGLQFQIGLDIGPVFFEYSLSGFLPNYYLTIPEENTSRKATVRDAVYYSYLGGNVGLGLPKVPLEIYSGMEKGTFGFSSANRTDFEGTTWKLGLNVFPTDRWGIKVEYRRLFIDGDDSGSYQGTSFSARVNYWFVGLMLGKR